MMIATGQSHKTCCPIKTLLNDMLRLRNVIVKKLYFIDALELFYTAEELSIVLGELGYVDVTVDTVFYGMLGFHRAVKPAQP